MKKFVIKPGVMFASLLVAMLMIGFSASASTSTTDCDKTAKGCEETTGGEEEKKKPQTISPEENTVNPDARLDQEDAGKGMLASPMNQPEESKPEEENEIKVNSFNFIFDLLYNFNFSEVVEMPAFDQTSHQYLANNMDGLHYYLMQDLTTAPIASVQY